MGEKILWRVGKRNAYEMRETRKKIGNNILQSGISKVKSFNFFGKKTKKKTEKLTEKKLTLEILNANSI